MFKALLFILVCCTTLTAVSAQAASISRDEYSNAYSSAIEKSREYSRRHKSKLVKSIGGSERTLSWDWQYEYPYKHRLLFEERTEKGISRLERIVLEDKTYCKADNANWTIETGTCETRLSWVITQQSYMLRANAFSKFTYDQQSINGVKVRSYREYALYGHSSGVGGNGKFSYYNESTFWVDGTGRLIKQSFKTGTLGTDQVSDTWEDEVDYDRNVKVAAPSL